jgi:hypothetical protein
VNPQVILGLLLHMVHVWVWALYFGSLTYIYARLFPDMRRWLASDERFETFSLVTGDGLRWWIFGALGASGLTGVGLAFLRSPAEARRIWWTLVGLKATLWLVTLLVYAYVSYIMWPRRVFVGADERPAEQRRFLLVAVLLAALQIGQLLLGIVAHGIVR